MYLCVIKRDLTDKKKAEMALKKSEEKLKELNATKDKFFSVIAHDLKSPFNAIMGFSDLMIKNFDQMDLETILKGLKIIDEASNHAHKLLDNLLLWARSQAKLNNYKSENVNVKKQLKESGLEIKSFRNKIAQLNKIIEEQKTNIKQLSEDLEQRNLMITERDTKITKLNSEIISKNDTIQAKSAIIEEKTYVITEKDNELNKAFFTSGTANQLVKNGVLIKEGGFLGLAKNKVIRDNINENSFTQLDIRNISQLPINAKKAKLISVHPDNSYQMIEENDKIAYLKIENPEEFWKLTRFVIVETK